MGIWELVVIFIVGLLVLGPERLPKAIRSGARWFKTIKQMANNVQAEINEELRVHELHQNLKKAEEQGFENLSPDLKRSVDELTEAAESVKNTYKKEVSKENNNDK